jgi:hypothetical protein
MQRFNSASGFGVRERDGDRRKSITYLLAVDDERHIELALAQLGQLGERGITLGLLLFGNQVRWIG